MNSHPAADPKKERLKHKFHKWVIRESDAGMAHYAWTAFRKAAKQDPIDPHLAQALLIAFTSAYGRLFSGDLALQAKHEVLPHEMPLHSQIMDARNGYAGHSDRDMRIVRVYPPGAQFEGSPVQNWYWGVRTIAYAVDPDEVEAFVVRLKQSFAERAREAIQMLVDHCGTSVPSTDVLLADF
jgi:hypothetical protein